MTRWHHLLILVALLLAVTLTGCGNTPSPAGTSSSSASSASTSGPLPLRFEPGGAAGLILLPLEMTSSPGEPGWKDYTVIFAIENPGPAVVNVGQVYDTGTIETQEGFTYNVYYTDFAGGANVVLPPHFRVRQVQLRFRAAETAHPIRARLSKFGTVDLTSLHTPVFPTDDPKPPLHRLSEGLQFPRTKITFKRLNKGPPTTLDVGIENLDKGQQNDDALPYCSVIDSAGHLYLLKWSENVSLGPGQMVEKSASFTDDIPQDKLSTAMMLCYNNYDSKTGEGTIDFFALT